MPFADDVADVEHPILPDRVRVEVELRGSDRALLRALVLRTGLSEAEVLRVALLGLAAPRAIGFGELGRFGR